MTFGNYVKGAGTPNLWEDYKKGLIGTGNTNTDNSAQQVQEQINQYMQMNTEAQTNKAAAEQENAQATQQLQEQMTQIQTGVSQATAQLASATSTLASAVSNLSSANANVASASQALTTTPQTIPETTKGEDGKEKTTQKENPAYQAALNAYNAAMEAQAQAQAQMETAQSQVEAIQSQAEEMQSALTELTSQNEEAQSQAETQTQEFDSQIQEYSNAITELQAQLQQIQAQQQVAEQNAQNSQDNVHPDSNFKKDEDGNYSYTYKDEQTGKTTRKGNLASSSATQVTYNDDGSVTKSNPDGTTTTTKTTIEDGKVVIEEVKKDSDGKELSTSKKQPDGTEIKDEADSPAVSKDVKDIVDDIDDAVDAYGEAIKELNNKAEISDEDKASIDSAVEKAKEKAKEQAAEIEKENADKTDGKISDEDKASIDSAVEKAKEKVKEQAAEIEKENADKKVDDTTKTDNKTTDKDEKEEVDPKDIENNISNNSKTPLIFDDSSKKLTIGDKEIEINEDGLTNDDIFNLKEDTSNGEKLYGETKDGKAVAISIDDNGGYKVEVSTEDKKDTAEKYTVNSAGALETQTAVLDDDGNVKTDDSGNKMYECQFRSAAEIQYAKEHQGKDDEFLNKDGQLEINSSETPLKQTTNSDGKEVIQYANKEIVLEDGLQDGYTYNNATGTAITFKDTVKTYSGKDEDGNNIIISVGKDGTYQVSTVSKDSGAVQSTDSVKKDGSIQNRTYELDENGKNLRYPTDDNNSIYTYTEQTKDELAENKSDDELFVKHSLQGGENYDRAYTERDAIRNHEELKTIENGLDNEDDFQGTLIDTDKYFDKFHNDYDKNDAASFAEYLDKVSEDITNDIVQHFEDYCLEENTVNTDKLTDIYKQIAIDNNIDTSALDSSDNEAFIDGINEIMAKTSWDGKLGNDYFDLSKIDEKIEDGTVGQEEKSEFALDINDDFTEINFGGNTIKLTDEGLKQTSTVGDKTNYSGTDEDGNEIMVSVDENGSYTIYKFDGDDKTKRNESYYLTSKGEFNETKYEYDKDGKKTSETSTTTTKTGDTTTSKTQFLSNGSKVSMFPKEENGETVYEVQGETYKTQEEAEKALKEIVKKDKEEAQKAKEED